MELEAVIAIVLFGGLIITGIVIYVKHTLEDKRLEEKRKEKDGRRTED